jgi:hypothetical protein
MGADREQRIAGYLLGRLSEQEEADLEGRYLSDDGLFEELLAVEADLRDAYERGELSRADRQAFEQRLLASSRHREKQAFARALCRYQTQARAPRPSNLLQTWKLMFEGSYRAIIPAVSAALVVLIAGVWWAAHKNAPRSGVGGGPPAVADSSPQTQGSEGKTLAVVLSGSLLRSGGPQLQEVVITPDVNQVQLEARVKADFPGYEAVLQTAESKPVWKESNLKAQGAGDAGRVLLTLSSSQLPSGDYILTLRGLPTAGVPETVAEYAFRVRRS